MYLHPNKYGKVSVLTAQLIRQFRQDLGMSQQEFAKHLGIPLGTLATYEVDTNLEGRMTKGKLRILTLMQNSQTILVARNACIAAQRSLEEIFKKTSKAINPES